MGKKKREAALIAEAKEKGFFDYPHRWDNMTKASPICTALKYHKNDGVAYLYNKMDGNIIWWSDKGWATVIKPAKSEQDLIIEEATKRGFVMGAVHTGQSGSGRYEITEPLRVVFGKLYGSEKGCIYSDGCWAKLIKEEKPLLIMDDDVPLFDNQDFYLVPIAQPICSDHKLFGIYKTRFEGDFGDGKPSISYKRFSTKQAAQDWIERQKAKPKDDSTNFILACKFARTKFVVEYWELFGDDKNARVWSENILIMYDQLVDRLSKLTINKTVE